MAIPKYNELYRPMLDCLSDGRDHSFSQLCAQIAAQLHLSETEQNEMLPSGVQTVFANRAGWCRTYLKKAGLIETPARGISRLTEAGRQVLAENPPVIDNQYLSRFPSFQEFLHRDPPTAAKLADSVVEPSDQTPQDTLESAYRQINDALCDALLSEILRQTPAFFERLVVQLLQKMGYGGAVGQSSGMVLGKTGDEGIDGIVREDKLGFRMIYIQAKRWDSGQTIGRPEIQKFVGALAGQGANSGLFITTAQFSKEAQAYAQKQHTAKVVLVDGALLAQLMVEHNLGVSTESVYEIKRLDTDFFHKDSGTDF